MSQPLLTQSTDRSPSMLKSIPLPVWTFVGGLFVAGFPNFIPFVPFV